MGRTEEGKATAEYRKERWKAPVDGGVIQLLEGSGLTRPPYVDIHRCHTVAKSVDGSHPQPNAGILQDNQIGTWLDPTISDPQQLGQLLKALPEDFLDCYAISRQINSVKFDEPEYAKEIALDYTGLLQNESSNQG